MKRIRISVSLNVIILSVLCGIITLSGCSQTKPKKDIWGDELHYRLMSEFWRSKDDVKKDIQKYIPDVTDAQMDRWISEGKLEYLVEQGDTLFFTKAAANLFRLDPQCAAIKGDTINKYENDDRINLPEIMTAVTAQTVSGKTSHDRYIAIPKRFRVKYTLSVDANAVPDGEKVRCWLPYPRTDVERQKDVKLLATSEKKYKISPSESAHCVLYMEKKAKEGQPTIFSETFEFTSSGEWHELNDSIVKMAADKVLPAGSTASGHYYNTETADYKHFTAERKDHCIFSRRMRNLADSLTAGMTNPYSQVKAIFTWINDNFPWASALEYSTIENIPDYVLEVGHGDCGQVTLLLMNLCRIKGIPIHWQSGFMMHPSGWNMHDWAEVYFEGIGWVPVDQSFGIPTFADRNTKMGYFFLGGIDSYRMVVNNDYGCPLVPEKNYTRSETVDFQRGEVEWKGGNIYFPMWDYTMEIEYL